MFNSDHAARVDAPHRFADLSLGRLLYDTFMADLMQQVLVDEDALGAAMERLMRDQHLRARMGHVGQRLVASQFTWDHVATRIYDLTERLTEMRLPAPPCSSRPACSPWKQFRSWPSSRHD